MVTAMKAVFADVDTGIDDAIALVYLLASADAELVGIASTGGNTAVDQVCANNLGLLELCRSPEIPVSKGADAPLGRKKQDPWTGYSKVHGPKGLGYAELPPTGRQLTNHDAAAAWVAAAHARPGDLIGLVTGPLTNLALALRAEPELPTLLRRLIIMGGRFDNPSCSSNNTSAAEWNIRVDPEAANEVFAGWAATASAQGQQSLPIVCGLDLTRVAAMTPDILTRLVYVAGAVDSPNPLIKMIGDALRFYFESHHDRGHGYLAYMHDPLAAAVALDPQLIATRVATVDVDLADIPGTTVADWSGNREPNARVGIGVDPVVFFDRVIERVGPFARRLGAT